MEIWLKSITNIVRDIGLLDIVDILLVAFLIYKGIQLVKETRAGQLVKGLLVIFISYFLAKMLGLRSMKFIMENVMNFGVIALLVVFQPELRRALEQVGRAKISDLGVFSMSPMDEKEEERAWRVAIDAICTGFPMLSKQKVGALLVIERQTKLGEIIKTGTIINATPSAELMGNIFFPNSPLHDGAVIMRMGRLYAAGCFLPLSENYDISKQLGTRHRASLGMSENSDALVLVVSEETGTISVAERGVLTRNFNPETLRNLLENRLLPDHRTESGKKKSVFRRKAK